VIVTDVATNRAGTAIAVGHGTATTTGTATVTGMAIHHGSIVIAEAGTVTEVAEIGALLAAFKFSKEGFGPLFCLAYEHCCPVIGRVSV